MTTDPAKRTDWQLSLATILAFVIAVAIWLTLATRANLMERPHIPIAVAIVVCVGAILAVRYRRRAVLLLIAIFSIIATFSFIEVRFEHFRELERRARRYEVLQAIEFALVGYQNATFEPLPPSTVATQSGDDLHRALMQKVTMERGTRVHVYGPITTGLPVRVENGVSHITGALGGRLLWARTVTRQSILIDSGPDNLFGGTLDANGVYTPGPVDANSDGKTDGEDDLIHFVGSHK